MHVRAQPGTRIEETARLFDLIEQTVRQTIPPDQLDNIVDNIGLPFSGINMAYQNTGTIGPEDGDALISLKEDHAPTDEYIKQLRTILPQKFPGTTFSFLPADIVSQILNFGLPAPIDVQVIGNNQKANYAYATRLLKRIRKVPGIADLRIQQVFNYPQINVDVDRTLAGEVGLTQRDVANSLLVTLSGSGQVHPNFWLNTENGVSYPIVAQMPQYRDRHDVRPCQRADHLGRRRRRRNISAAWRGSRRGRARASYRTIMCSRSSTSTAQSRSATSAPSPATSSTSCNETRKDVPRGSYVAVERPGPHHDQRLQPALLRARRRHRADLSGDRGQLPVLARSLHHRHGACPRRSPASSGCCS